VNLIWHQHFLIAFILKISRGHPKFWAKLNNVRAVDGP